MSRPSPPRFHAVGRGRVTIIAVPIMIAWHLVADVEMGITLGSSPGCSGPGRRLDKYFEAAATSTKRDSRQVDEPSRR
jgi:hypothetical protein